MNHLRYLKMLNFAAATLFILGAILVLLLAMTSSFKDFFTGISVLGTLGEGLIAAFLLFGVGALHLLTGYLVAAQRGRLVQTFLAIVHLLSFPIGTAYSIYALWLCWFSSTTKNAFNARLKPWVT